MSARDRGELAIVHDYLSQRGGAERVVLSMARRYPEAPIYTSFWAEDRCYPEFRQLDVRTSRLQGRIDPAHFRRSVLALPRAFATLDLSGFDRVLISSSAFAHHVSHPNAAVYCYTPPRFLYEPEAYLDSPVLSAALWPGLAWLRRRDRAAAAAKQAYAAISRQSASRIEAAYGRRSELLYPPLATAHLPSQLSPLPATPRALVISRLLPYKRVDLAIAACTEAGIGLSIVGEGPEEARLRQLAAGTDTSFLGRVDDDELRALYAEHSVLLAPGVEDFGLGPVEAAYAGRPALAVAAGGALETVIDGETGLLVDGDDPRRWAAKLTRLLELPWDPVVLRSSTERFAEPRFFRQLEAWLEASLA